MSNNADLLELVPKSIRFPYFNCLGFAVGIYVWLGPGRDVVVDDYTFIDSLLSEVNHFCANEGEERIRIISSEKELQGNEYVVLVSYDLGSCDPDDWNFHAIRKYQDKWVDKLGSGKIEYIPENIDPLEDDWIWGDIIDYLSPGSPVQMFAVNPDIEINATYILDKPIYFKAPAEMKITPNTTYSTKEFEFSKVKGDNCCLGFNDKFIIVDGADQDIMEVIDEDTIVNYNIRTCYFNSDSNRGRIYGYLV